MDESVPVTPVFTAATRLAEVESRGRRFSEIYQPEKKRKKLRPSSSDVIKDFLESNRNCDVDQKGHNRLIQVVKNMVDIATSPRSPFAVAAANFLFDRAYGKPKPSVEEIEAIGKGGIQLVYVSQQANDPDIPVRRELPEAKPEFVEGEVYGNE